MIKCTKCKKKIPSGWTMAFKNRIQTNGTEIIEAFHIRCSKTEFYLYDQVPHKHFVWIFVESCADQITRIFKHILNRMKLYR
jgi:hypothetical protein